MLDTGCGTGVLGCCLAKNNPSLEVHFQDRDALALACTTYNLKENRITSGFVYSGLLLPDKGAGQYDLLVSNLPAKAGAPVLQDFFRRCPVYVTPGGAAAVVVISALRDLAGSALQTSGYTILTEEHSTRHSVFIFRSGQSSGQMPDPGLTPYIRYSGTFHPAGPGYHLDTVYNIPEFDTPGYASVLAARMLHRRAMKGPILFLNPGQGHVPCSLAAGDSSRGCGIVLAGRDLLSLRITAHNLGKLGINPEIHHIPAIHCLQDMFDTGSTGGCIAFPDTIPGRREHETILKTAEKLLTAGGLLLVAGKSSNLSPFDRIKTPLIPRESKKYRGFRAILFENRA